MIDVKLTVGGKEYTKTKPKLNDYRMMLEYNKSHSGQSFLSDLEPLDGAIEIICAWFGGAFSRTDLENEDFDLDVLFDAYKAIESNISEVFTGVPLRTALERLRNIEPLTKE